MKKILLGMMAAILVLTMAAGALAEEAGCGRGCMRGGSGVRRYVDADGDGVCDYCGRGGRGSDVDAEGDGGCDHCGQDGCGYYVDADGDGVCDYCGQGGRYYVDADGDGVCDNYNGGARGGAGRGRGGRR